MMTGQDGQTQTDRQPGRLVRKGSGCNMRLLVCVCGGGGGASF